MNKNFLDYLVLAIPAIIAFGFNRKLFIVKFHSTTEYICMYYISGEEEIHLFTSLWQVKVTRLTCWLEWLVGKNKFTFTWRNEDKWKSGSTLMMCSGCCMYSTLPNNHTLPK